MRFMIFIHYVLRFILGVIVGSIVWIALGSPTIGGTSEQEAPTKENPHTDETGLSWWYENDRLTNGDIVANCPNGQVVTVTMRELRLKAKKSRPVQDNPETQTNDELIPTEPPPPPTPEEGLGKFESRETRDAYYDLLEELGGVPHYCVELDFEEEVDYDPIVPPV